MQSVFQEQNKRENPSSTHSCSYQTHVPQNCALQTAVLDRDDCSFFAGGDTNGNVYVWNTKQQAHKQSFRVSKEVTALAFHNVDSNSNLEKQIAAGSLAGVITLCDLAQSKTIRQYSGHRSEVRKIHFQENYVMASASSDCNVKLWDVRQRQSIMTYKGHTSSVNCVLFSPDGKWLASADSNGITKLWDIAQAKVIHEFHDQSTVNDIIFHPDELVLATGSVNKVVRFWDLETWEHLGRTQKVTTPIKKILFPCAPVHASKEQEAIYSNINHVCFAATKDSLRLWKWEPRPVSCIQNVETHWHDLSDMAQDPSTGCLTLMEVNQSDISLWKIDIATILSQETHAKICVSKRKMKPVSMDQKVSRLSNQSRTTRAENQTPRFRSSSIPSTPKDKDDSYLTMSDTTKPFMDDKTTPEDNQDSQALTIGLSMMTQHQSIMRLFSNRLRQLRKLKSLWKKRLDRQFINELQHNPEKNIQRLVMKSILHDISKKLFSIQFCTKLLGSVERTLLKSNELSLLQLGLEFFLHVIKAFSQAIEAMAKSKQDPSTMDVSMQDRKNNCNRCLIALQNLKPDLSLLTSNEDENVCSTADACLNALQKLEDSTS